MRKRIIQTHSKGNFVIYSLQCGHTVKRRENEPMKAGYYSTIKDLECPHCTGFHKLRK